MTILVIVAVAYFLFLRQEGDYLWFGVAAAAGPIGEALVSRSGLWTYHGETIFGIPSWLPLAWGITAVVMRRFLTDVLSILGGRFSE